MTAKKKALAETSVEAAGEKKDKRFRRSFGPYLFDAKTANEVLLNLKIGCPVVLAVATAGITRKTVYNWSRRGRQELEAEQAKGSEKVTPLAKFYKDFRRALHATNRMHVQTLFSASANGNTDVAKWWLSRRMPDFFGPKAQEIVMTGKRGGAPIAVEARNPDDMTSDEMSRRMAELERAAIARAATPLDTTSRRDEDDEDGDPADDIE